MADGASADSRRLMQIIAALSAAPETVSRAGRLLPQPNSVARTPLQLLLGEVDETVLRRYLVFEAANGAVLELDVAERRILKVRDAPKFCDPDGIAAEGRALTEDDLGALGGLMRRFAALGPPFHVVSNLPDHQDAEQFRGVSAEEVDALGEEVPVAPAMDTRLAAAIDAVKAQARAVIIRDEDRTVAWGDARLCSQLEALELWRAPTTSPDLVLWRGALDEGSALLLARNTSTAVCALLDGADFQSLMLFLRTALIERV